MKATVHVVAALAGTGCIDPTAECYQVDDLMSTHFATLLCSPVGSILHASYVSICDHSGDGDRDGGNCAACFECLFVSSDTV